MYYKCVKNLSLMHAAANVTLTDHLGEAGLPSSVEWFVGL